MIVYLLCSQTIQTISVQVSSVKVASLATDFRFRLILLRQPAFPVLTFTSESMEGIDHIYLQNLIIIYIYI